MKYFDKDKFSLNSLPNNREVYETVTGTWVKSRRTAKKLTQKELAELCNITSKSTISRIESGELEPKGAIKAALWFILKD
jgi:DNA-binding transcriptional regulator YiaG